MDAPRERLTPQETLRWTRIGLLSALAMALGYLETFIPIPIPGVKLGLANITILIALSQRDIAGSFCIGIVKVLAAGLLFGNPLSMAYSAAGTLLALAVMAPLSRLRTMRLTMVSTTGALAHELGQLLVAALLLGTWLVWYSAPVLLLAGCATGLLCGAIASRAVHLLEEDGQTPSGAPDAERPSLDAPPEAPMRATTARMRAKPLFACFLAYCIAVLHATSAISLGICLAIAAAACAAGHVRAHAIAWALRPLAVILVITIAAQVAVLQEGAVLLRLGPVAITAEALTQSAVMFVRLLDITAASVALMHLASTEELAETAAWMLGPLRRLGVRTEGFALAFQVALQAVPALVHAARSQMPEWKDQMGKRSFWKTTVPRFIADIYRQAGNPCRGPAQARPQHTEGP